MPDGTCSLSFCDRTGRLKLTMCEMHYQRQRAGKPLNPPPRTGDEPKTCRDCGEVKPLERFARKGKHRASRCKDCLRVEAVDYRRTNGEMISARDKERREADPAHRAARRAAWYARNAERVQAERREKYRVQYAIDPSPWHAARARRKQRRGSLDATEREMSRAYRAAIRNDPCWYCTNRVDGDMHDDHYFPLSKGGTDHWWNLVRACGSCNRRKHAYCGTWFALRRGTVEPARSVPPLSEAGPEHCRVS